MSYKLDFGNSKRTIEKYLTAVKIIKNSIVQKRAGRPGNETREFEGRLEDGHSGHDEYRVSSMFGKLNDSCL